jgi:phospholipase C
VQMGAEVVDAWDVSPSGHWYDFIVTNPYDPTFQRRIAGHGEDGRPSISDPLLGRQS